MEIIDFIIVAICGFGIGILSGMFGIGGGGMIVPLLHIAFGLPIIGATSTSLLTIAPTGISGSIKHLMQKTASLKTGLLTGGFGAIASVGGSFWADSLPDYLVVILTGTVILFSVAMMLRTLLKDRNLGREKEVVEREVPEAEIGAVPLSDALTYEEEFKQPETKKQKSTLSSILPIIIGLIAGGIAGTVGVGGGFIIVPFCVAYLGFTLKQAAGTSLIAISLIAIPGIVSHAFLGHIWWFYGLAIIIGTIPGAQLGALLISRLPERPMRFAFAGLLTITGITMLAQEFFF